MLDDAAIAGNIEGITSVFRTFLDFDEETSFARPAELVNNDEWLSGRASVSTAVWIENSAVWCLRVSRDGCTRLECTMESVLESLRRPVASTLELSRSYPNRLLETLPVVANRYTVCRDVRSGLP